MTCRKLWTAICPLSGGGLLMAQCKSSKSELVRRIANDDAIWRLYPVQFVRERRWPRKLFRRGLAFKYSDGV